MIRTETATIDLPDLAATHRLADALAQAARPGLVVLLDGPVGAGKTTLARRAVQSCLARHNLHEDVPSPTFTIVQTYVAGPLEIWHADLYRLTSTYELEELGLAAAFDSAFCLVEWPDRLGYDKPLGLEIMMTYGASDDARQAVLTATGPGLNAMETLLATQMT